MMRAVYPGSFDPITNGHLDIIFRGAKLFDELRVAVLNNVSKKSLFSSEERIEMIKENIKEYDNIIVEPFDGLLINYAKEVKADVIIRGLRAVSDYEYELQMALANKKLYDGIETIFLVSNSKYSYLSSSLVKEIAHFDGNLQDFVPVNVNIKLKEKFSKEV
ncbi:MAG: pantetheine-phosphate adenylyltransferase [Ezakiella massiliensis]|uniref:pantetheine-phosphate adenylyltransferase n=1 Tax=Ezakiella massiliensis TaxID=1852374 RepID=UPI0012FE9251|nr:pantetheine-phosphate adenylyltransferase [Ezakiella massiliensis]